MQGSRGPPPAIPISPFHTCTVISNLKRLTRIIGSIFTILAAIFGLGYYGPLLALGLSILAWVPAYRRWLSHQPGYIYRLARWPGLYPPRVLNLLIPLPLYVLGLWIVALILLALIEIRPLETWIWFGNQITNPSPASSELIPAALGLMFGLVGLFALYFWLTGHWDLLNSGDWERQETSDRQPFQSSIPGEQPFHYQDPAARSRLIQAYLELPLMSLSPHKGAHFRLLVRSFLEGFLAHPLIFFFAALAFGLLFGFMMLAGWFVWGPILALPATILAFSRRYRTWLLRQPGYTQRLALMPGWKSMTPIRLAGVSLAYLVPVPLISWVLSGGTVLLFVLIGAFGLILLYGFWIRNWGMHYPGERLLRFYPLRRRKLDQKLAKIDQLIAKKDLRQAKNLGEQTLAEAREVFNDWHLAVGNCHSRMGSVEMALGNYEEAAERSQQAYWIKRHALGDLRPEVAQAAYESGRHLTVLGKYGQAEQHLREAIIPARYFGKEDLAPLYPAIMNAFGKVFQNEKHFSAAAAFYHEALTLRERWLKDPEGDWLVERIVSNLTSLYIEVEDRSNATQYLDRQVRIHRQRYAEPHIRGIDLTINQARYHLSFSADPKLALIPAQSGLNITRDTVGDSHPLTARVLDILAEIDTAGGRYQQAIDHLYQAESILQGKNLTQIPLYEDLKFQLGQALALSGDYSEAWDQYRLGLELSHRSIEEILDTASEFERLTFLQEKKKQLDAFLSVHLLLEGERFPARAAFNEVVWRKGLATEVSMLQQQSLGSTNALNNRDRQMELKALNQEISRRSLAGPDGYSDELNRQMLKESLVRKEKLGTFQGGKLAGQLSKLPARWDTQAVAQALPTGTALVEILRYQRSNFEAGDPLHANPRQTPGYLAFILPSGKAAEVHLVDLGEAALIDQTLAEYRALLTGEQGSGVNGPDPNDRARESRKINPGRTLGQLVWEPIETLLDGNRQIFLAPDGELTRIPFEVLISRGGGFLAEWYTFTYLSAGRDLLRTDEPSPPAGLPVVIADPDFDLRSDTFFSKLFSDEDHPSGTLTERIFQPLAGTRAEGQQVAAALNIAPLLGKEALESALSGLPSPKVLHIASHGYFLPEVQPEARQTLTRLDRIQGQADPLLRSGLALAGANTWLAEGPLPAAVEDGLLTALDVSGLDLRSTDLVVLSACDTGLGETLSGEGVFGLRRAFLLAGAGSLIMSLWKVPDKETRQLMAHFYEEYLKGQKPARALAKARLQVKATQPHPFFWGAFICQGVPDSSS